MFGKVVIGDIRHIKQNKFIDINPDDYVNKINDFECPCEVTGIYQTKPYFDYDEVIDNKTENEKILELKNEIVKILNLTSDKDIYCQSRGIREKNSIKKYSYHFSVDKMRISYYNLKKLTKNSSFDNVVYRKNAGLHSIYTDKKCKDEDIITVPKLEPLDDAHISKHLVSYVEESFENLDLKFDENIEKNNDNTIKNVFKNICCDSNELSLISKLVLECLSYNRAENYEDWIKLGLCLRNIDYNLLDVWDEFSKNGSTYKSGECQNLWDNFNQNGKLTLGSLKYWAKLDNKFKYEELIQQTIYPYIDKCIRSDGAHYDVAEVISVISKDKIVYDSSVKSWFVMDKYNVWKEDKEALFFNTLCSVEICNLYMKRSIYWNNMVVDDEKSEEIQAANNEKAKRSLKIAGQLKNSGFIGSVLTPFKSLMAQNNFVENKLDSNTDIFCFNDCLYDLNMCTIRSIEPEDYVFTTTGYNYNANIDENVKQKIYNFLREVHLNEELYQYNLDVMSSCLIGRNIYQELYFKTGSGANGKSTEQGLYEQAFGNYAMCPNAEVLTKQSRGANETSELHKSKGKRILFMQEPEAEDKIITSRAKKLSGGDKLCVRGLFCNPIEFSPQFKIIMSLNDMIQFSKVDGGIQRRTRVIEYPFKFVDNPTNEMTKQIDRSLEQYFKTDIKYRDACISILIDNWPNIKGLPKLNTPQSVMEESKDYCNESNKVLGFINERFEITNDPNDMIMCKLLLSMYNNYTRDNISSTMFGNRIRDMGIKKVRKGNKNIFYYIGIKEIEDKDD
jgi:P4 family phage/plasmid primase-like protien